MRLSLARFFNKDTALADSDGVPGQPVSCLAAGQCGRVVATLGGNAEREHLRALGLEPGVEVRVCRAGTPCVLGLDFACGGSCRIGVGRKMADQILVDCTLERGPADEGI
jgi:Fe2+ transport system protein FeoA